MTEIAPDPPPTALVELVAEAVADPDPPFRPLAEVLEVAVTVVAAPEPPLRPVALVALV